MSRITFNNRFLTSHLWLTELTSEMDNTVLVCTENGSGMEIRAWRLYIESKDKYTIIIQRAERADSLGMAGGLG